MPSIIQTIVVECTFPESLAQFWATALGLPMYGDDGEDWMAVGAAKQRGLRLLFKRVPDAPAAKGRLHIDLTPETSRVEEVARLVDAGATVVGEHDRWTVLHDPEGNAFCVLDPPSAAPGP